MRSLVETSATYDTIGLLILIIQCARLLDPGGPWCQILSLIVLLRTHNKPPLHHPGSPFATRPALWEGEKKGILRPLLGQPEVPHVHRDPAIWLHLGERPGRKRVQKRGV